MVPTVLNTYLQHHNNVHVGCLLKKQHLVAMETLWSVTNQRALLGIIGATISMLT